MASAGCQIEDRDYNSAVVSGLDFERFGRPARRRSRLPRVIDASYGDVTYDPLS